MSPRTFSAAPSERKTCARSRTEMPGTAKVRCFELNQAVIWSALSTFGPMIGTVGNAAFAGFGFSVATTPTVIDATTASASTTVSNFRMRARILRGPVWGRVGAARRQPPDASSEIRRPFLSPRRYGPGFARFEYPPVERCSPTLWGLSDDGEDPPMRLFVTGAAGFIGSNYVRHVLGS